MPKIQKEEPEPVEPTFDDVRAAVADVSEEPRIVELDDETYVVPTSETGDIELFEAIMDYADGNKLLLPRIVRKLIGDEQYEAFKKKHRDPATGVVPYPPLVRLFNKIDAALGE